MFCDSQKGCYGVGGGREIQEGGDLCKPMANLCCYMTETSIIL